MKLLKVDAKGRITISKELRKRLKIHPGDTLSLDIDKDGRTFIGKKYNLIDVIGDDFL